jgi:hypothetical protein
MKNSQRDLDVYSLRDASLAASRAGQESLLFWLLQQPYGPGITPDIVGAAARGGYATFFFTLLSMLQRQVAELAPATAAQVGVRV